MYSGDPSNLTRVIPAEGREGRPYPSGMRFFCFYATYFMRLTVNGEIIEKSNAGTVMELLDELQIEPFQVAVEVNLSIIRKADYSTFRLNDGDKVEIVKFVGGG